ncbi:protein FAR1-RELATED SEQUENCE 5-like [Salvia hispanica]|uniref:protein FAR1-RELATED SEQUENCE 5-like n=1 Tax=Salvia hispanica TaxID=49212 RepID=UPI002009222C|nr:protein FAR1-RELATED SEQUENCE 5-like [Salvia hispanica]
MACMYAWLLFLIALQPVVGQKFKSLDFGFAFYDVYAHAVGFDTRKSQMRKIDGITTWYSVVCNREGSKKSSEDDQANARSGFSIKRRRLSKRCGCKARISFKFFSEGGVPGYFIEKFTEVHNHYMVESEHQHFMSLNRNLEDVHHQFILDCSKANIGPTLTFNVLKEILGGFQLVGCNVGDIRNASRDIKAYAHGIDMQMVLDDMAKKKEMSEAFTYEYEVNASNQLVALFWCDGLMKRNYHMFGDIVAFDTTYNTNRYCMIFAPFTRNDNHGRSVTFAAGLDGDFKKEFNACVWSDLLEPDKFKEEWNGVLERYGLEDHGWLKTLYDYRQLWIPAYFRDFPLGSMIRTTSISESENSFYKNFLKPRNNIAEFYLNFNQALEFQRDSRTKLDYQDANALPILATTLPFEKHASTMYTDSMFKKIQEEIFERNDRCRVLGFSSADLVDTYKLGDSLRNSYFVRHDKSDASYSCDCKLFGRQGYLCSHIFFLFRNNEVKKIPDQYCASRWMKTPLAKAVHGQFDDTLPTKSIVDERQNISKQEISLFYGFLRRFESDINVLRAFVGGLEDLGNSLQAGNPTMSASEKRRMIEQFYGMERPEVVEVYPSDVVKTKGHASSSQAV